ncbi:MAG: hypothetical protein AM326_04685 [Candidatus Thorarchaeota archaeon SMTZ-45]|nr:MAG: hypothetical protein AM326_04685 [Candidatus Thorarchaeota archaeon SMTZ-45]KXH74891.1 MAG: hypothetical protein AM325_11890 [Candidatus Thorarchaeota archaeon SMTZ1-45]
MSDTLQKLDQIEKIVSQDPKKTPPEVRKQFWRIVREIKRSPNPDITEVAQAARIRNVLFKEKRGRTYSLWPCIVLLTLIGALGPTLWYLRLLEVSLDWNAFLVWTTSDWWIFLRRLGSLLAATFFFYPLGRLIAGKWAGIRIDGMSRGMYNEPTLKIDYETFLLTPPPKRKWFFFFAGIWTVITSFGIGFVGFILVGDLCGIITAIFLGISEGAAIWSGTTKNIGGEMAHYNRERKIERSWKRQIGA